MAYDFKSVAVPHETTIEIYDANGKKAGLRITVLPETSDKYQKVKRWAVDKYKAARGKKLPTAKEREIEEKLFCARLGGWEWHGPLKDAAEDFPFNPSKCRELLFGDEPFQIMVNKQISEAITDEANFTEEQ